ncbi:MAG: ATP-binding protein [Eubacteriales bacterium]
MGNGMNILDALLEYVSSIISYYLEINLEKWTVIEPLRKGIIIDEIYQAKKDLDTAINNNDVLENFDRLARITEICEHNHLAVHTVYICVFFHVYPRVTRVLKEQGIEDITLELTANILYDIFPEVHEVTYLEMEKAYDKVKLLILTKSVEDIFYRIPLLVDQRLYSYICGSDHIDNDVNHFIEMFHHQSTIQPLYEGEEQLQDIRIAMTYHEEYNSCPTLQLSGAMGCGKKLLVQHACQILQCNMLFVDVKMFDLDNVKRVQDNLTFINREMLFYHTGICFWNIGEVNSVVGMEEINKFLNHCHSSITRTIQPYILCTTDDVTLIPQMDEFLEHITINELSRLERVVMWEGYCNQFGLDNLDCVDIGTRFKLTPAEIRKACKRLALLVNRGEKLTVQLVSNVCMQVLPAPSQGNIKKINVTYNMDDLKLGEEQKQALMNLCAHIKYRYKVYDTWGMEEKYSYGKNVSALFVGASGTGKTMAVHVLSNLLNLPLYKIDLSQVVDKYIGETEKRLENIFSTAEKNNVILFFDEADAIFGKRSEVNDAKDKYANTEVSYILQRIEQYDGIVILATNYKKNIDEAFMRRIRYFLEFPLPNIQLRKEIWQSCFSDKVPMENIDFDYLAREFELTGGTIKNIVLNAVFQAAETDNILKMKHILKCIKIENAKVGKIMLEQDFNEYSHLL